MERSRSERILVVSIEPAAPSVARTSEGSSGPLEHLVGGPHQDPELGFINGWAPEGSSTPAPEKKVVAID